MPLNFTYDMIDWTSSVSLHAIDATGKRVVIMVSHEAMHDYGASHSREVASDKYDNGLIEPDGTVVVRTSDFLTAPIVGR